MTMLVKFSILLFPLGPRSDATNLLLLSKHSGQYHSDSDGDHQNFMQNLETRYRDLKCWLSVFSLKILKNPKTEQGWRGDKHKPD